MTARRRVVSALGIAVLAPSLTSLAQPPKSQTRIGFLPLGSPTSNYDRSLVDAFRQGLREFALIENRDVTVDVVWVGNESGGGFSDSNRNGTCACDEPLTSNRLPRVMNFE